jgi:hypothetical protein
MPLIRLKKRMMGSAENEEDGNKLKKRSYKLSERKLHRKHSLCLYPRIFTFEKWIGKIWR